METVAIREEYGLLMKKMFDEEFAQPKQRGPYIDISKQWAIYLKETRQPFRIHDRLTLTAPGVPLFARCGLY